MTVLDIRYGDITTYKIQCIVNASNESGLGCFTPNHPCIDNAIHKAAGPSLLAECRTLKGIPTGTAKLTKGYSLAADYIIHATGPIASINPKTEDYRMLAKTYLACLDLAAASGIKDIAFCCISTGMFGFNKAKSSQIAYNTVKNWVTANPTILNRVVFNVFTQEDYDLYTKLVFPIKRL